MSTDSTEPKQPPDALDLGNFRRKPAEAGLSLEQLNAAFAEMLRSGEDPYAVDETADSVQLIAAPGGVDTVASEPDFEVTPRAIVEAMLFVGSPGNKPLSSHDMAKQMRGVRPAEIDAWIGELNDQYDARKCPYHIVAEGPGYQLRLRDEFGPARESFYGKARHARLSEAAIEVLAIVAYNQPIAATEIHRLRGVPSGHVLAQLVRRELLQLHRTPEKPRGLYATTDRLLSLLGLENLTDLPRPQDVESQP